jgi:hypothetical protein
VREELGQLVSRTVQADWVWPQAVVIHSIYDSGSIRDDWDTTKT